MTTLTIETSEAMEAFGRWLGSTVRAGDVVVLSGALGAGKTTMTRGLGEALGVTPPVQSPTFILAREHDRFDVEAPRLVHVDAYRLGSPGELHDLDIDWAGSIGVIEWGRPYVSAITREWLDVNIDLPHAVDDAPDGQVEDNLVRWVTVTAHSVGGEPSARLGGIVEAAHDFSY